MGKLNGAYADGLREHQRHPGPEAPRRRELARPHGEPDLTGLTIDHYIQVDLLGFVPHQQRHRWRADQLVPRRQRHRRLQPGARLRRWVRPRNCPRASTPSRACTALEFVRQRHNLPNGDLDRVAPPAVLPDRRPSARSPRSGCCSSSSRIGDAINRSVVLCRQEPEPDRSRPPAGERSAANNIVGKTIPHHRFGTTDGGTSVAVRQPDEGEEVRVQRLINPPATSPRRRPRPPSRPRRASPSPRPASTVGQQVRLGDRREMHQLTAPEPAVFADLLRADAARPFVTYYDEASGERSELSAKSVANWVAKTHHLLGDRARPRCR